MNEQSAKEWLIKAWHNLSGAKIFYEVNHYEDIALLDQVSEYHIEKSYPAFDRKLPPREEIKEVLDFTEELFDKVCNVLDIETAEVKC